MKLGSRKIIGGKAKDIYKEIKIDHHPEPKKNFMREAKAISKKHSK